MANFFGATYVVDAYVISYNIGTMVLEGFIAAIATAFIPLFSKKSEEEGEASANLFLSRTNNMLLIITVFVTLLCTVFSRQIVFIFARGWFSDPSMAGAIELANFYVKVTFGTMVLSSVAGVVEAFLRYKNVFISTLLAGFPLNILHIIFIIIAYMFDLKALVFGLFFGNLIRIVIVLSLARKKGYRHEWDFHFSGTVKLVFALSFPIFLGTTTEQINAFVNRLIASWLPEGSIAALNYSFMLVGIITGVASLVLFSMMYPKMAQAYARDDMERWRFLFSSGIVINIMITVPFSIMGMLYSRAIVRAVYERNAFDSAATEMTVPAFFFYSLGLAFIALIPFLARSYYSIHDTKTPVKIAIASAALNIILNLILVRYLAHGGLALGMSIASMFNVGLLLLFMNRSMGEGFGKSLLLKSLKIISASAIAAGFSYVFYLVAINITTDLSPNTSNYICILFAAFAMVSIYAVFMKIFKIEEMKYFYQALRGSGKKSGK